VANKFDVPTWVKRETLSEYFGTIFGDLGKRLVAAVPDDKLDEFADSVARDLSTIMGMPEDEEDE